MKQRVPVAPKQLSFSNKPYSNQKEKRSINSAFCWPWGYFAKKLLPSTVRKKSSLSTIQLFGSAFLPKKLRKLFFALLWQHQSAMRNRFQEDCSGLFEYFHYSSK